MREQEKQDNFLEVVGQATAERLQRIWVNTYPKFCSIPYGEEMPRNHTQEEVFREECRQQKFSKKDVELFLGL